MNAEQILGFEIRKLAVVGDSGGGFMILNIIKFAIRNNLRVPDACCLLYPCRFCIKLRCEVSL